MPRKRKAAVRSFSLKLETLERLREVVGETEIAGGASAIAEDAISGWLRRYAADPNGWLISRGIAHKTEASSDDL